MDYYSLLGLEGRRGASSLPPAEVKHAYKRALLLYHPDKQNSTPHLTTNLVTVDEITLAYKVLSDSALRSEYDRRLGAHTLGGDQKTAPDHAAHPGTETVDLDDLEFDSKSGVWTRKCRCGSDPAFVVTELELEKNLDYGELDIGCQGCSLWLKVLFTAGD